MKIIHRYIARSILGTIGLAIGLLMGLFIFVLFVAELPDIGKGGYGAWQALQYVMLCMPAQAYQFFPMAALVGGLMGLGTLASHSELIVMRSAGITIGQVLLSVMRTAFILAIVIGIVGEVSAPWLLHQAKVRKEHQQQRNQSIATAHGIWVRDHNAFIRIDSLMPHHMLCGVTIYTFGEQHQLIKTQFAKAAVKKGDHWQLEDVIESDFTADHITQYHFNTLAWSVEIDPNLLGSADADLSNPENMNLIKLHWYSHYLRKNHLRDAKYALSFWRRICQPLAILIMMFLAVPFIFGPLRTLPMGYRIIAGIGTGFGFYFLNQLFGPLSLIYDFPPILSAILPLIPFSLLGIWLVRRMG